MRIGDMNHILYVYDKVNEQDEFGAVDDIQTEEIKTNVWDYKENRYKRITRIKKAVIKAKVEYATSSSEISAERKMHPNTLTITTYRCAPIGDDDIILDPYMNYLYTVASMVPVGKLFMEIHLERYDV